MSTVQVAVITTSTMIGIPVLALPRFVADQAGSGAPLASVIGVMITFAGLLATLLLGRRFPSETIIGYNQIILGKWLGRLMSLLLVVFFVLLMGLEIRQFAEVVAGALLPDTPIRVSIFIMIFLCVAAGFQSVATFAYIHFFYFPLILIPFFIVMIPAFRDITSYHLLPIAGSDSSLRSMLGGGLVTAQAVLNFIIVGMVIPFMKKPKHCVSGGIWGFIIGSAMVIGLITMTVGVFGEREIVELIWPTLVLGRMIKVPSEVLARVDSILLISWIYAVFTTTLSYYFIVVRGAGELFRFHRYRLISIIGAPIIFTIAVIPRNIMQMYNYILAVTLWGLLICIVHPVFLLIVAKLTGKKEGMS
ncbi:GerAB/ArcD/ProY family transporter [Marinicrinis lubricantis]|uniref:GerAB/ArcD/ProY family transporter n=1 Tax=Marinicrinis lubricantis TaxID=2086470 RepID=UPI0039EE7CD3